MARKKTIESEVVQELKKLSENKALIIGAEKTIKAMRKNTVKKVYVSATCAEKTKETINHYGLLNKIIIVNLEEKSDALGVICKKPFNISIVASS